MTAKSRLSPSCPECKSISWQDLVIVNGEDWTKCSNCGYMQKIAKRTVTPIGNK